MPEEKKTCFVVMGFKKKTDYATGRVLDLDKSYHYIIKPAAEAAGLNCIRADEIINSGMIDVPMYEQLLTADVVVADLSTSNANAFYELGVRHALRPHTTITIAEDQMAYPFDVNHIAFQTYKHLGDNIDYGEAIRMQNQLRKAIETIATKPVDDSPVYVFLKNLKPPMRELAQAIADATAAEGASSAEAAPGSAGNRETVSLLMAQAEEAIEKDDFVKAMALLDVVKRILKSDPFVTQKLALATYKSKVPNALAALENAKTILEELQPANSTDPETLGLWGAIHKRLWDLNGVAADLDTAIHSYAKGFYLKNDYYNGINLAFLMNVRAAVSDTANAIADFVLGERIRRQVLTICQGLLDSGRKLPDEYWLRATFAEAWLGLGERDKSRAALDAAFHMSPAPAGWMKLSTQEQLERLEKLLDKSPLGKIGA